MATRCLLIWGVWPFRHTGALGPLWARPTKTPALAQLPDTLVPSGPPLKHLPWRSYRTPWSPLGPHSNTCSGAATGALGPLWARPPPPGASAVMSRGDGTLYRNQTPACPERTSPTLGSNCRFVPQRAESPHQRKGDNDSGRSRVQTPGVWQIQGSDPRGVVHPGWDPRGVARPGWDPRGVARPGWGSGGGGGQSSGGSRSDPWVGPHRGLQRIQGLFSAGGGGSGGSSNTRSPPTEK